MKTILDKGAPLSVWMATRGAERTRRCPECRPKWTYVDPPRNRRWLVRVDVYVEHVNLDPGFDPQLRQHVAREVAVAARHRDPNSAAEDRFYRAVDRGVHGRVCVEARATSRRQVSVSR